MAYTKSTATELLLAKLELTFPSFEYKECKHIKHGYDHDILIIDGYVYRFPKTDYYLKQLKSETRLTAYLAKKVNLRFPIYNFVANDGTFARHRFISGAEVTKTTFKNLSKMTLDVITSDIANFLSVLHTIPSSKYQSFGFEENKYNKPLGNVPKYVPTHSDLDINNMIWSDTDGLGIIDFGDRCLFDPAYDFTVLPMFGEAFLNDVYRKYIGIKDANFLERVQLYYKRYCADKI